MESSDGKRQLLLTLATAIKVEWLRGFPGAVREEVEVLFDQTARRVIGRSVLLFHDLVLDEKRTERVPPGAAAALLTREVIAGNCPLKRRGCGPNERTISFSWS